ncbi:hypothetical protein FRC01_012554, partial [Tulasnella sp. 417]
DLIRERAALEKEYAQKLQAIARKAAEKRSRTAAARIVGEDPAKAFGDDAIRRNLISNDGADVNLVSHVACSTESTLESAYAMLIEAYDTSAQDHASFGEALSTQISQDLKNLEQKKDGTRKKQLAAYNKTLSERDKIYNERLRAKQKYDEECLEIEGYRQKQSRAADDKHADRAAKQYDSQKAEMQNSKNTYIISIAVANKAKDTFYNVDLPALENQFQEMQTSLTTSLIRIVRSHQHLQSTALEGLKYKMTLVDNSLSAFDATKDQVLFVEYNKRPGFSVPGNWDWEPCAGFYETGVMSVEPTPKVYLQNKLAKAHSKLDEVRALEKTKGDSSIWGLSKQGKTCKACGLSVHAKCELKVPAECPAATGGRRAPPARNVPSTMKDSGDTMLMRQVSGRGAPSSLSVTVPEGRVAAPTPSAFNAPSASAFSQPALPKATIMFDFVASSPFEMNVVEGQAVEVVEEDDGSGWIKVGNPKTGEKGLVPASYVQIDGAQEEAAPPPPTVNRGSRPQGSGKFVKGVYDYSAQGDDEISVQVGRRIELTAAGMSYGDGWAEGIDESGKKGIFPSNYVEAV